MSAFTVKSGYPPIYAQVPRFTANPVANEVAMASLLATEQTLTVATRLATDRTDLKQLLNANARLSDRKLPAPAVYISPSQLGVFDNCRRRWAWENVAGFRSPPTPSQILGTRVHSVFEAWLKHGTPPNRSTLEGRVALKGLHHLPPPGMGEVEKKFYLTTRSGLHFHGIADWMGWHPTLGAVVIDHKTTSAMKWAKTPAELEFDVQALLYAIFACISMQTDHVTLRWNYVQTDAKKALLVESSLHLGQIIERFPIVERRAAEMTAHRREKTHPLRVLPNPLACADYSGCPHQHRCRLSPTETMEAIMANEQNGTMREHMTALQGYRPPVDGAFPPPAAPPFGAAAVASAPPGYPAGVEPVSGYLPPGPTQIHAAPEAAPQQPAFTPPAQQPAQQPMMSAVPFYQDPTTGFLIDATTGQYLPREHPAYSHLDSYRQYQVQPPAHAIARAQQQQPYQPPQHPTPADVITLGGPAPGQPQFQPPAPIGAASAQGYQQPPPVMANPPTQFGNPQQPQFPNYPPNAGPNAPEQHADPAQIPAHIATPPLAVAGVTDTAKTRKRRTKAEIEAERAAAGGSTAHAMQEAALGGGSLGPVGEQLAFVQAMSGALANPSVAIGSVTAVQLEYIGNMAREAFKKAFGGLK